MTPQYHPVVPCQSRLADDLKAQAIGDGHQAASRTLCVSRATICLGESPISHREYGPRYFMHMNPGHINADGDTSSVTKNQYSELCATTQASTTVTDLRTGF